uniref:Secreted protein n=1 Tax=Ascaris lumbricoides TaxID=6252 RepID=A0A0M3IPM0_ASCLU
MLFSYHRRGCSLRIASFSVSHCFVIVRRTLLNPSSTPLSGHCVSEKRVRAVGFKVYAVRWASCSLRCC